MSKVTSLGGVFTIHCTWMFTGHAQGNVFFTKTDHSLLLLCGEWVVVFTVVHKQWLTTVYLSSSVPSSE